MNQLYIEERRLAGGALSREIAYHLFARHVCGRVIVITDNPQSILSAIRKQWIQLTRRTQRELSSTLEPVGVIALSKQISRMQTMRFVTTPEPELAMASVVVLRPTEILELGFVCQTLYLTCEVSDEVLTQFTTRMPVGALLVLIRK